MNELPEFSKFIHSQDSLQRLVMVMREFIGGCVYILCVLGRVGRVWRETGASVD